MSGSNVYLRFFPNDHLNDLNLRGCHAAAKGIWMDMVCLMAQGMPYGHLRIDPGAAPPPAKTRARVRATALNPNRASALDENRASALPVALMVALDDDAFTLPENGSLERDLARLIGQPPDLVEAALAHLERRRVFSRDDTGVIFCRRMVNEAKRIEANKQRGRKNYEKGAKDPSGKSVRGQTPNKQAGQVPSSKTGQVPSSKTGQVPSPIPTTRDITLPPAPSPAGRGRVDPAKAIKEIGRRLKR